MGLQRWDNSFQTEPLFRYQGSVFIESYEEDSPFSLFAQAGFEIEAIEATRVEPPPWWHTSGFKLASSHALKIDEDNLSAYAFLVRAKLK